MDYLFATMGGSGSNYLTQRLATRLDVGNKPDTIFRPFIPELRIGNLNAKQGIWSERTPGFPRVPGESIDAFLVRYVGFLRESDCGTAVFNTCAELGLFSKYAVQNVVFLIRHPLHAYASWSKPERHGEIIDHLGGINAEPAVQMFMRRWNRTVTEAIRLRHMGILGGLVRYESAREDASKLPGLEWVFSEFDSSKRNWGYVSSQAEELAREITRHVFDAIYFNWKL